MKTCAFRVGHQACAVRHQETRSDPAFRYACATARRRPTPGRVRITGLSFTKLLQLIGLVVRRDLDGGIPLGLCIDTLAHGASHASHSGGPRAGVMRGAWESAPM